MNEIMINNKIEQYSRKQQQIPVIWPYNQLTLIIWLIIMYLCLLEYPITDIIKTYSLSKFNSDINCKDCTSQKYFFYKKNHELLEILFHINTI